MTQAGLEHMWQTNIDPHHGYTQNILHQMVHFTDELGRWESELPNTGITRYVPWKQTIRLVYPSCLKKNQNARRPSEHPPVRGGKCQNV